MNPINSFINVVDAIDNKLILVILQSILPASISLCETLNRILVAWMSGSEIRDGIASLSQNSDALISSTLSDYIILFFKDRNSGWDCRNPGPRDEFKFAVHGTVCPLTGEHDELSDNLTK